MFRGTGANRIEGDRIYILYIKKWVLEKIDEKEVRLRKRKWVYEIWKGIFWV